MADRFAAETQRWNKLVRKYTAAVKLDRENLRSRLLAVLPNERQGINEVFRAYETEYPVDLEATE